MDENDEDGDEDGFAEVLEAYEEEKKAKKSASHSKDVKGGVAVMTISSGDTATVGSLSMDAVADEDLLVSAMQSASISGSRISDMPTP